jgi:deazaflavin-dependent oxidoreductase (nitroreductase family)
MVIAASVILLLAILLTPILLLRFRKRWVAAFNLAVTNRITSRFANRLPGFGILTHVGRRSGKLYRTPVNVFRAPKGFLIALTYGRDSEWVKNVIVAGTCQLETRRLLYQLSAPTIVHDPTRRRFPLPVRMVLGIVGANDFMQLSTSRAVHVVSSYFRLRRSLLIGRGKIARRSFQTPVTAAQEFGKYLTPPTCCRGDGSPFETIAYRAACRAPLTPTSIVYFVTDSWL